MMTLANYGIGSSKHNKDPNSAKVLSKSLQIRNRAELLLKQCLKSHYKLTNEKRNELFNSIGDYYSRIPFNVVIWNKYQTKQCIIDSILLLDSKFDPYKAREAFRLVEKMLVNLVHLPWHQEFRKIFTYSGRFRLSISDPLIGIEEIFKAAGFQQSRDCPMHLILPDDKMPQSDDGESVTGVIFDCLLAQVVFTNIIEVFENCCKASKQSKENISDVNCYSWIQAYFRERSHQTTEHACSSIQELLNNITNHLSKIETAKLSSSSNEQITTATTNHQLNDRNGASILKSVSNNETRASPKLTAQERTREFLAQQSHEDDNLLTLSNELLRLPVTNTSFLDGSGVKRVVSQSKFNVHDGLQRTTVRPPYGESIHQQQQSLLNNGYNTHHPYHKQALYDRTSTPATKQPLEPYDSVDHHQHHHHGSIYCNSNDSLSHPTEVDVSHNDREPLIPRYDRRLVIHQIQSASQSKSRNSLYDNDFDSLIMKPNGAGHHLGSGRHHFDEPYFSESASHPPSLSSNHMINSNRGITSSKYNSSPHRKYESRDMDKQTNSRSYWSCGSCTYNNQISSEICEMCRNRRPLR